MHTSRHRFWVTAALVVITGGTALAWFAGESIVHRDYVDSRRSFDSASTDIASTLRLALQHEEDLLVDNRVYFSRHPRPTQRDFMQLWADLDVTSRYPEFIAIGHVVPVPKAELDAFVMARNAALADAPGGTAEPFVLYPPGDRPEYCLVDVGTFKPGAFSVPTGLDVCSANGPSMAAVRESGTRSVVAVHLAGKTYLGMHAAVYREGADVSTAAARREAFIGWVGMTFDTATVFAQALDGHPHTSLELRFQEGGTVATFSGGKAPARSQSKEMNLVGGWTLTTRGPVVHTGLVGDSRARYLFLVGAFVAWLLGALVLLLATGRTRALHLVAKRTAELESALTSLGVSESDKTKLLEGLVAASEKERSWVAAQLHDGLIQRLVAVGFALDRAHRKLGRGDDDGLAMLASTRTDLADVIGDVRRLMGELRPPALDESGLAGALADYGGRYTSETGIACEVDFVTAADIPPIGAELETVIYRVVQEALTNVRRHASASRVTVAVRVDVGALHLTVRDDGVGFDTSHQRQFLDTEHFGLRAMRERVENVGGEWSIESSPEGGTVIEASLPVERAKATADLVLLAG